MKVYQVYPDLHCAPHCEDTLEKAVEATKCWLEDGEVGALVSIKILEMSQEEYDALPEYDGP